MCPTYASLPPAAGSHQHTTTIKITSVPPPNPALPQVPHQFQGPGIQERVRCYVVAEGFDRYALQDAILRREGSLQAYAEVLMSDFKRVGDTRCVGWQAGGMGCRGGGRGRCRCRVESGGAGISQAGMLSPPGCLSGFAALVAVTAPAPHRRPSPPACTPARLPAPLLQHQLCAVF